MYSKINIQNVVTNVYIYFSYVSFNNINVSLKEKGGMLNLEGVLLLLKKTSYITETSLLQTQKQRHREVHGS